MSHISESEGRQKIVLIDPKQGVASMGKIEGGVNRNQVFSANEGLVIFKAETEKEINNYRIVDKYREQLLVKGVCFPFVLRSESLDSVPGYFALVSLPFFYPYSIEEHF